MTKIEKIKSKIQRIENLIDDLKKDIVQLEQDTKETEKNKTKIKKTEEIPNSKILKEVYDDLYKSFMNHDSKVVDEFIKSKNMEYLNAFCKSNNIILDSKQRSKAKISEEIIKYFIQRKAITKKSL
ncbi:MAG: hypothetical protein GF353_27210 [Candidatus Lokiarchaeota archaeon]|nr:hypothetical protein [Candidatus Lokiarchaeota archaeon]